MYTEWALQLQEELQRSVMLHQQLHQMRGQLESEKSELSIALGRPGPRPAAPAKVASRGSSLPSAPASVDGLQRLAGASAGGAAACMCSGVRHASPQVAPPTGKRKRNHAAMGAGAWQASEPQLSTSAPSSMSPLTPAVPSIQPIVTMPTRRAARAFAPLRTPRRNRCRC